MATLLRKPALLARDVAAMRDLSGARFELGLGAGYVREEFEAAELPFPSARQRVEYLQHVMEFLRRHVPDVPILIAGSGDRLLTVAARQARLRSGPRQPGGPRVPGARRAECVPASWGVPGALAGRLSGALSSACLLSRQQPALCDRPGPDGGQPTPGALPPSTTTVL